jgi:hypothetical protein
MYISNTQKDITDKFTYELAMLIIASTHSIRN